VLPTPSLPLTLAIRPLPLPWPPSCNGDEAYIVSRQAYTELARPSAGLEYIPGCTLHQHESAVPALGTPPPRMARGDDWVRVGHAAARQEARCIVSRAPQMPMDCSTITAAHRRVRRTTPLDRQRPPALLAAVRLEELPRPPLVIQSVDQSLHRGPYSCTRQSKKRSPLAVKVFYASKCLGLGR